RSKHIPIIFVTALSKEEQHVYRGYSAGAVDYIFKPIDPQVLRAKVSVFVELWEKTQQLQQQADQLEGAQVARSGGGGGESHRGHLGRAVPMRDDAGRIEFWVGTATDIHDRKLIEDQRTFIVAASDALSHSLDYRETLSQVAELAVGEMADWCAVHVVEQD